MKNTFVSIAVTSLVVIAGCSSDNGSGSTSSGATASSSSGGTSGSSGGGGCSGDITQCTVGSLSSSQRADVCNLTLSIADPGSKYECTSGPNKGLFLTVDSKEKCNAQVYPANCSVKVQQILDCYKAAKADACAAFGPSGACTVLLNESKSCGG